MKEQSRLQLARRWLFGRCTARRPSGQIFISYRWADAQGFVDLILDRLEERFGRESVFCDINILPGEDFREVIRRELATCYAVLVVIGPRWLTVTDDQGRRRIDNPRDLLRTEVQYALDNDSRLRVIPVLVDGATMPRPELLPAPIERLAYRVAHELSRTHRRADLDRLIQRLERPREDRFAPWRDICPPGFPTAPLIANALFRPYWLNLLVPLALLAAGFLWSSWLWIAAAVSYAAFAAITLFDLQQARCVRSLFGASSADEEAATERLTA